MRVKDKGINEIAREDMNDSKGPIYNKHIDRRLHQSKPRWRIKQIQNFALFFQTTLFS